MRLLSVVLVFACMACGDDDGGLDAAADAFDAGADADVGTDANLPDPPVLEAEPDPDIPTGCMGDAPAAGETRAKLVECAEELTAGSVATGRNGDIVMDNAVARFIIRASSDEASTLIGGFSGAVIDAARQGGRDLLKEVFSGYDLSVARPTAIVITEAGGTEAARVRVLFELNENLLIAGAIGIPSRVPDAFGAIDYELRPDEGVLRIRFQLSPKAGLARVAGRPSIFCLTGGGMELIQPGGRSVLGEDDNLGQDVGSWMLGEAEQDAFAVHLLGEGGSVVNANTIQIVQRSERLVVQAGELGTSETLLGVGASAAEAHAWVAEGDEYRDVTFRARAGERVEVRQGDALWLRTRVDDAGEANVRVRSGDVSGQAGFDEFFTGDVVMGAGPLDVPPAVASTLRVEGLADGEVAPVRVTVERGGAELMRFPAFGPTTRRLPPGDATVTISRGLEYDVHVEDVSFVADTEHVVSGDIARVVDTSGWVAGDFHLHSEMSTDSQHSLPNAVRTIAGEGLEVVAATDHDVITDYMPFLEEAGLTDWVLAIAGSEVSDPILAHINGYPLVRNADAAGFGSPRWFEQTPLDTFDELRELGDEDLGGAIVQVNHPTRNGSGWFRSIMLDPISGMAGSSPADIGLPPGTDLNDFDFDVIETFNKGPDDDDELALEQTLGLWENGWRFGMMGNSDTHDAKRPSGNPRTYIRVPDDTDFTWPDVAAGIRSNAITISGGIFVTAEAGAVTGDGVPVTVRIQAAPWVEVDSIRIYAGPNVVIDESITPSVDVLRLEQTYDVPLAGSDFVVVRANGAARAAPVINAEPFGITSPIEVR